MRRIVPLVGLLVLLAGCGSSGGTPPTATSGLKTYTDPTFHFSFKYPSSWQAPTNGGKTETVGSVKTYVVSVKAPNNAAQLQVTVDGQIITFPAFVDGKISADPSGGPDTFHYLHASVSGLPAMHVERWNARNTDEIDTFVNTRNKAYDIRINTGTPPFPKDIAAGYSTVVRTMKLGLT